MCSHSIKASKAMVTNLNQSTQQFHKQLCGPQLHHYHERPEMRYLTLGSHSHRNEPTLGLQPVHMIFSPPLRAKTLSCKHTEAWPHQT
jgi:hypothetical protein